MRFTAEAVKVDVSRWDDEFLELATRLALRVGQPIVECATEPNPLVKDGEVVLYFDPTKTGRLVVAHADNAGEFERVNTLIATRHGTIKDVETDACDPAQRSSGGPGSPFYGGRRPGRGDRQFPGPR